MKRLSKARSFHVLSVRGRVIAISAVCAVTAMSSATAVADIIPRALQNNLLANALTDDPSLLYSKEAFYGRWGLYYADGQEVEPDYRTNSQFTVITGGRFRYNGEDHDVPADCTNFYNGSRAVVLDYKSGSRSLMDCCFTYPIEVDYEGNYQIVGVARSLTPEFPKGYETPLSETYRMVITFSETPGNVEFSQKNYVLEVSNTAGGKFTYCEIPYPPGGINYDAKIFQENVTLTTEMRYLSIYAPFMQEMLLSELTLVPGIWSDVDGVPGLPAEGAGEPELYDLSGRKMEAGALQPGVYIERTGGAARLIRR